jgi:hypothetical protein
MALILDEVKQRPTATRSVKAEMEGRIEHEPFLSICLVVHAPPNVPKMLNVFARHLWNA